MKTNAIIRIVIYSLIILLLLAILAAGLGIGTLSFDLTFGSSNYITGEGSVSASDVRELEIEWAAGSITIQTADTDQISFSEEGYGGDSQQMVYELKGDRLTICYSKPSIQISFFSYSDKDLTITVPNDWICDELEIAVASAKLDVSNLTVTTADVDAASGVCNFRDCTVGTLDVDTASGDVRFSGSLNSLECDAASANITAVFTNVPDEIISDTASGKLDITLPTDCGFTVTMDTLSGRFSSDFPVNSNGNRHTYGDGSCNIDVDSASGNVTIRKAS